MASAALVDRLRPGDHVCWAFADDAERRALCAAAVRGGLRDDQRVVYLTAAVEPGEALAELARARVDTGAALRAGRLRVAGADDTYLAPGHFDAQAAHAMFREEVRQARRAGYAGLRAVGDMTWAARGVPGTGQLPRYERQVNRLYADGYALAVCLYDRRLFGEPGFGELARAHPATYLPRTSGRVAAPLLRMVRRGGGLRLAGEADLSNRDALATVLTHLLDDSPAPVVTLDLTELRFADASTCELILQLARGSSGRLRIAARPSLRRLLRLQGADSVPGLLDAPDQTPVG